MAKPGEPSSVVYGYLPANFFELVRPLQSVPRENSLSHRFQSQEGFVIGLSADLQEIVGKEGAGEFPCRGSRGCPLSFLLSHKGALRACMNIPFDSPSSFR